MKKKIDFLRQYMAAGEWQKAMAMAVKFPRLGMHKEAIERAHMAYTNPRFLTQLGKNTNECIKSGINALIIEFLE